MEAAGADNDRVQNLQRHYAPVMDARPAVSARLHVDEEKEEEEEKGRHAEAYFVDRRVTNEDLAILARLDTLANVRVERHLRGITPWEMERIYS